MKRLICLATLLLSMAAFGWNNLTTYGNPGATYPVFPFPNYVPVYINTAVDTALGGGDNSSIYKAAMNRVNVFGSKNYYYYAGLTSLTSCVNGRGRVNIVLASGTSTTCNSLGTLYFQAVAAGLGTSHAVVQATSSSAYTEANSAEEVIARAIAASMGGTAGPSGVGNTIPDGLNTFFGGLYPRPIVANPISGSTTIGAESVASTPRPLGIGRAGCQRMPSGTDGYACVEHDLNFNIRMVRYSFTSPAAATTTCTTATQLNCYNNITGTFLDSDPVLTLDTTRNIWWAGAGGFLWTSTNGITWIVRDNQTPVALAYNSFDDQIVEMVTYDINTTSPANFVTHPIVINASWGATPYGTPFTIAHNIFQTAGGANLAGLPDTTPTRATQPYLECSRLDGTTGLSRCTITYSDGNRERNLRRLSFHPVGGAGNVPTVVLTNTIVTDSGGAFYRAPQASSTTTCYIGNMCDNSFVFLGDDPSAAYPLSVKTNTGAWTGSFYPRPVGTASYIMTGPTTVLRTASGVNYLVGRHDVFEYW